MFTLLLLYIIQNIILDYYWFKIYHTSIHEIYISEFWIKIQCNVKEKRCLNDSNDHKGGGRSPILFKYDEVYNYKIQSLSNPAIHNSATV